MTLLFTGTLKRRQNPDILADMMYERNQAIENLDFDRAENIHNEIQKEVTRRAEDDFARIKLNISESIKPIQKKYTLAITQLKNDRFKKEHENHSTYMMKIASENQFYNAEVAKLEELMNNQIESIEIDLTEYDAIIQQAKSAAISHNFDDARKLKEQAETLKNSQENNVKDSLTEQYNSQIAEASARHEQLLKKLMQNFYENQRSNSNEFDECLQKAQNEMKSSLALVFQRAEAETKALTASKEVTDKMLKYLHEKNKTLEQQIINEQPISMKDSDESADSVFITQNRPMTARVAKTATTPRNFTVSTPRRSLNRVSLNSPRASTTRGKLTLPKSVFF